MHGTWKGAEFWLATVMACRGLGRGYRRKEVNSFEGVLARASPAKIHANFLRAVVGVKMGMMPWKKTYIGMSYIYQTKEKKLTTYIF